MSLYDDASLIAYPSGYKESKIYAQKPVPSYGAEQITNGDFATDSNWTKGTGWSISGGAANCDGTQTANSTLVQQNGVLGAVIDFVVGKTYKVNFDIIVTSGQISNVEVASGYDFSPITTSKNHTVYITAVSTNDRFTITANPSFIGSISNVSVKEVLNNGDLTFSRASSATRVNAEGLIETASILGSEEVTNGDFASGTGWSLVGDFAISGGKASITSASQYSQLTSQGTNFLTSGKKYKLQVDIETLSISGVFAYRFSGGAVTPILTSQIVDGKFEATFTMPSNGYLWFQTTGSYTGLNVSIDNASVKEVITSNIPRIDYSNGCGSLLLEPQRTNLIINSNSGASSTANMNLVYNNATSPDGTQNAYKSTTTSTSNAHVRTLNIAFADTSTFSVFLKYGNNQWYQILNASANTLYVNVDIQNGVFGTSGSGTSNLAIKDYGNGWYRVSGTFTYAGSATTLRVYTGSLSNHGYAGTNATIGSYNYGFGFQVEEGSYPTSYIPTSGTSTTRIADAASKTGLSSVINSTEGVLYAEISALADDGTSRDISINDGTSSNYVRISLSNASANIEYNVVVGGSTQASGLSAITQTDLNKIALKYKLNDFALWVNGVEVLTDSSGLTFSASTLTNLSYNRGTGVNPFFGNVQNLMVFPSALTDDELADLTGAVHQTFNSLATFYGYTIL